MNQPHKHKDMIIAWANGEEIEYRDPNVSMEWGSIKVPAWFDNVQYRVKPEPKESVHTFRIGVGAYGDGTFYTITADNAVEEQGIQSEPNFIGWITDWEPFLLVKEEE